MDSDHRQFWILRSTGRLREARDLWLVLISRSSLAPRAREDLKLMEISLIRADQGAPEATQVFSALETSGFFKTTPRSFQFHYQKALNAFAQSRFSEALELLLLAEPAATDPWDRVLLLTCRMICLDNLGFPSRSVTDALESLLNTSPSLLPSELSSQARVILQAAQAREAFREGRLKDVLSFGDESRWSQVESFAAWVSTLPFTKLNSVWTERAIMRLTEDADFYLRNYRLQTLSGRAYQATSGAVSTWRDRVDRLYLWTWRWLENPTSSRSQALTAVLAELETWDGSDVLTVEDAALLKNSLQWVLLFEPRFRSRWAAWLRRAESMAVNEPAPLFSYEELWQKWLQARLTGSESQRTEMEKQLSEHSLWTQESLRFREVLENRLAPMTSTADARMSVDPESGEIRQNGNRLVLSSPLAHLFALLLVAGKASFAELLSTAYGIAPYDPVIHDSKVQNLVMRARQILPTDRLKTKNRWIFLEDPASLVQLESAEFRPKLALSESPPVRQRDRVRNERSLSILLKEGASLRGRDISRAEMEQIFQIPKPTLNRYLRSWIDRGWLLKGGSGRATVYRITFFDS